MSDTSFSSLIYRIIGKPERWHDDYIVEMMQQYLNESDSVDDPLNLLELAAGDQILQRLQQGNLAVNAFNTLLDKSRFQMIILDEHLKPIYYNRIAEGLLQFIQDPYKNGNLKPALLEQIRSAPLAIPANHKSGLVALDFTDEEGDQVYLRSLSSRVSNTGAPTVFNILMVLDKHHADIQLNPELIVRYKLTDREQGIVVGLIHGKTIKEIAAESFTAETTVRTHLKSIFRKTDTGSQGALISLILTHEAQLLDSYFDSDITTYEGSTVSDYDRSMVLADGLELHYCDYGPEDGRPLIVFHSGFGSRLAIPPQWQAVCEKHNRRLIIPDRPGLGKTLFVEGHPQRWNEQLQNFVDQLGLAEYEVLGSIIASQMAMSYADYADERLTRLILTSPVFLNTDDDADYLTEILSPAARYVKMSPTFAREIYTLWLKSVTLNLDAHYPSILEESIGSAEKAYFDEHNIPQLLTDVFKEGARQSLDGILSEMVFCMTPLNLDLNQMQIPIEVWFGTEDKRITQVGVETIFSRLPNARLHIREGYSEHIYYALFDEIIA